MVLENKLNMKDSSELARQEEKISKKKTLELFEKTFLTVIKPALLKHYQKFINICLMKYIILRVKSET